MMIMLPVEVRLGFGLDAWCQRAAHLGKGISLGSPVQASRLYLNPARLEGWKLKRAWVFPHHFQPGFAQCQGNFTLPGAKSLYLSHAHPFCSAGTSVPFLLCGLEGNAAFTSVLSLLNTRDNKPDSCVPSFSSSSGPVRGFLYLGIERQ